VRVGVEGICTIGERGWDSSKVCNSMLAWIPDHPEWDILRVRGDKSTDEARFFDE
jgi:hypothetical protein